MRFVEQLAPLLRGSSLARVVSVLGGGFEYGLAKDDLDLKVKYSTLHCAMNSVTMTTLAMERLAGSPDNKNLSFVHTFPGIVLGTNIYNNSFPAPIAALYNYAVGPMMWPLSIGLQESGERNLFLATSPRYSRSKNMQATTLDMGDLAMGSDGTPGSGVFLANWKGETSMGGKVLQNLRSADMAEAVWKHTEAIWDQASHL